MKNLINPASGTFWTGIGLVGFGIYTIITGNQQEGIQRVMEGLGLIFVRRAIANL